ncbi:MAG: hypothetical protein P8N76_01085 [Pirellulaceae bacterium]|nr:hypothetical protein [Pirellulaceae bacterium]
MKPRLIALVFACGFFALAIGNTALAGCDDCRCCPPPPVEMTFCAEDPCTCCKYAVEVCVPACCVNEAPCVTWRHGIFGRRIATYTWKCCGFSFDVVVNRHGRHWVR